MGAEEVEERWGSACRQSKWNQEGEPSVPIPQDCHGVPQVDSIGADYSS